MHKLRYIDGQPVDPAYQAAVESLVSSACAAEEMVELDELEAYASSVRSVAVQCTDRTTRRVGTFIHAGDMRAVSPVFSSYCELLVWLRDHGYESVPSPSGQALVRRREG